jgi:PAS domain S-box-containing protein
MGMAVGESNHALAEMVLEIVRMAMKEPSLLTGLAFLEKVRELSRAKTIIVFQCQELEGGKKFHRLLGIRPENQRLAPDSPEVVRMTEIINNLAEPTVWGREGAAGEAESLMATLNYGLSLALPLWVGGERMGTMLMVGLTDEAQVQSFLEIHESLSTLVGLVLMNSFLHEQQKKLMADYKQAEEELIKYRNLVELTNDWVWELDDTFHFTHVGPTIRQVAGYDPQEVLGKTFFDFMSGDPTHPFGDLSGSILESHTPFSSLVSPFRSKDGSTRLIEISGIPLFGEDNKFRGYRGVVCDISKRKKGAAQLARIVFLKECLLGPEPLAKKLNRITAGIVEIFEADFARIWTIREGDRCGRGCPHAPVTEGLNVCRDRTRCLHLIASSGRYTHLDGDHARVPFGAYKIGRIADSTENQFVINDVVNDPRVGDHEWARSLGLVSFAGFRLVSSEQKPIGVLALFSRSPISVEEAALLEDLAVTTSRIVQAAIAEEALRESEERYRILMEWAPEAVTVFDVDRHRFVDANRNAERLFGCDREVLLSSGPERFYPADQPDGRPMAESVQEHCDETMAGKEVVFNRAIRTLGGTDRVCEVRLVRLPFKELHYLRASYIDITDRRTMEEELDLYRKHLEDLVRVRTTELEAARDKAESADRLKSIFLATMSHELRTPLNSIIGFTGMTLQGLSGELTEEQRDNLTRAYRSAKHLLGLITDIIDISKIEADRIEVQAQPVVLADLVGEVVAGLQPQIEEKNLAVEIKVPPDLKLTTDPKRLGQCLQNVLSNAVKYTEAGKITVEARAINGAVEVAVSDTGIGIAEKDLPRVFDPFERFNSPLSVKAGGTGLGLYLTRKLVVNVLHGAIEAQSAPGRGSTFRIRLPKNGSKEEAKP